MLNRVTCPDCGSKDISYQYEVDTFEYGAGEDCVVLEATVNVGTCGKCGFRFTGSQAEDAREAVIADYLASEKIHDKELEWN